MIDDEHGEQQLPPDHLDPADQPTDATATAPVLADRVEVHNLTLGISYGIYEADQGRRVAASAPSGHTVEITAVE